MPATGPQTRLTRVEREDLILDVAQRLFYARGVHEVGMDELVHETGLGKASVYRLYSTKDQLIGAYLARSSSRILAMIDRRIAAHPHDPRAAVRGIFRDAARDARRAEFRGCAFNNASIEFDDPAHPARTVARDHRLALLARFTELGEQLRPGRGRNLGRQLALVLDGLYTSAAHLGPKGPASQALTLVDLVLDEG